MSYRILHVIINAQVNYHNLRIWTEMKNWGRKKSCEAPNICEMCLNLTLKSEARASAEHSAVTACLLPPVPLENILLS